MNYFAHAYPHLHRPYFVAGLAVPDWLSVIDRKCRVRRRTLDEQIPLLRGDEQELASGILRHLDDDRWFHGSAAFYELTGTIGRGFREALPPDDEWRCGFLGHIVLELLIDSVLIEDDPDALRHYYEVLQEIDGLQVEHGVGALSTRKPDQLAHFIGLFLQERFLEDYVDDLRLLRRLNQVMRRVGLTPLPREVAGILADARGQVRQRMGDLLPEPMARS